MYRLYNSDNLKVLNYLSEDEKFYADCIYADCIYESKDFSWINICYWLLKPNGVFYVQTDYHSVYDMKLYLDDLFGEENFINHLIYLQEWGGTSKRFFSKKHDDILMYSKGQNYKFYYDRIMIPKKTAGTNFDKRGDGLKIPCDVFYDLGNFSTMSKERIKNGDTNIKWQKPLKLMDRLLLPVTDTGDLILDPFMGSGTTGEWCIRNDRNFVGIELSDEIFDIAEKRLNDLSRV